MALKAKKSLGQHFLTSEHVLAQIIDAACIRPDEKVLEIGPGTGILTSALIAAHANVVAIEKDTRAIAYLSQKFASEIADSKIKLIEGDILEEQSLETKLEEGKYIIVANIPYYITGAILQKFLEEGPRPRRMILLLQREVAERIVAKDAKESLLSISVKAFGRPKIISKVPRGAFSPIPKVDSAILSVDDISNSEFTKRNLDARHFFKIVRAGFSHKRKYLIRNLESFTNLGTLKNIWKDIKIDEKIRAENIDLTQWLEIASKIQAL